MGGGAGSYREVEETDLIVLWRSNARETHPIFFHHLLKGVHTEPQLFVVDPRRTTSAQWTEKWPGLHVGTDIALANAVAREILAAGLENRDFVENATSGFKNSASTCRSSPSSMPNTCGVPAELNRELAHAYAGPGARRFAGPWASPAPQRGGQRAGADQPGPADRTCGA